MAWGCRFSGRVTTIIRTGTRLLDGSPEVQEVYAYFKGVANGGVIVRMPEAVGPIEPSIGLPFDMVRDVIAKALREGCTMRRLPLPDIKGPWQMNNFTAELGVHACRVVELQFPSAEQELTKCNEVLAMADDVRTDPCPGLTAHPPASTFVERPRAPARGRAPKQ